MCYMMCKIDKYESDSKANHRRDQEPYDHLLSFTPMWNNSHSCLGEHKCNTYAKYGTNKCMRTRDWKCQVPGSEIPYDGRKKDRKYKNNTKTYRLTHDCTKGEEVHDAHRNSNTTKEHSEKVESSSNQYRLLWLKRMTIYNRRNSICGIVHSIYEFKCTYNQ